MYRPMRRKQPPFLAQRKAGTIQTAYPNTYSIPKMNPKFIVIGLILSILYPQDACTKEPNMKDSIPISKTSTKNGITVSVEIAARFTPANSPLLIEVKN